MNDVNYITSYPYPEDFPFEICDSKGNTHMPPILHQHNALELNYIISGSGTNYIEDKKYNVKAGELYFINNFEKHISVSNGDLKMKILTFSPQFLWQNTSDNIDLLSPFYSKTSYFSNRLELSQNHLEKIQSILKELELEWENKENGYRLYIKAKLMELICIIYRYLSAEETLESTIAIQNNYNKIRPSIEYINNNFSSNLQLNELADLSYMGKSYFSTYFKKITGMTVWEYIELIRINHAQLELITTDYPITSIAFNCGFHSISNFNASFKKITKQTPSAYRKLHTNN